MTEYGSDFHFIDSYFSERAHLTNVYKEVLFFADGRQCVIALLRQYGWKRIWMPEYFCYEVINTIKEMTGVEIAYYNDFPGNDARGVVATLPYRDGDVLFRVNYFGLRDFRSEKEIAIPVIEDHTHDLMGHWSLYSDADWCIASLRKTLPIPMGGMMWSPKQHRMDSLDLKESRECIDIAVRRWQAMEMKTAYLRGENVSKDDFRKLFLYTEEWFDHAEISGIDERSESFIRKLDINAWVNTKRKNWKILYQLVKTKAQVLIPEDSSCNVFSFIVIAKDKVQRDRWKKELIERNVYPAILWNVPDNVHAHAKDMSDRMLSVHCDGRYSEEDMEHLATILNQVLK